MAEENAAQHRVRIKLLGVRLCDDKLPDGKACHAGVLVTGHLVQIAVGRFPFFCNTVCQLRALLLGHQRFVIEDISRTRQIAVDAVRRVIPCAGLVDHVQQVFHHSTSRAFSGMVARRMVEVIRPPVLQAGFVPLVFLLVLINVGCRFQHSFRYHRVIVVAQVSHQGHLIHVHGINEPLPRDVRIQLLIIGRLDDAHGEVEQLKIPLAVRLCLAGDRQTDVAEAADDVLPRLGVHLLVPADIAGRFHKVCMDAGFQQIDPMVVVPDVEVMQGDAVVVKLLHDHPVVLAEAGGFQQQTVDLVGHAAVLAVAKVEQPPCKGFEVGDLLVRQRFRVQHIDQLIQQGVVLLHQPKGAHRVALNLFQQRLRGRLRRKLWFGECPYPAQVLDIAFAFFGIRCFHSGHPLFRKKMKSFSSPKKQLLSFIIRFKITKINCF